MPRLYHRSQLALHIKRAICAHHVVHPLLRHVDLAHWCFTRFGVRLDRSTIGRVLKGAERWRIPDDAVDAVRMRGGAYPDLERAMARWIANAGPAGVPLTLATIRDHLFTRYIEQLDATMNAEDRTIVVLLDNANSHNLTTEGAVTEDLFGFRTRALKNVRLVFMPPNTTCFIQPLDQGLIAMANALYRQHWLRAFTGMWTAKAPPPRQLARFGGGPTVGGDIGLDDDVNDVSSLIDRLGLGPSAMPAQEFVGIDENQPRCAEPGDDPLAIEPQSEPTAEMWEAPASMQVVYDDNNPATREASRTARAACEMLIGYASARHASRAGPVRTV
ncbi:unnamed protein product [Closterium sp. NIES-64]|nr:unnamed protein product [Closterium sp. NIES-64]